MKMAQVGGNFEAWKQSGMVKKLAWLMSDSHDVDDECDESDGEVVNFGEEFSCGVMYPPCHVNCECSVMAAAIEGLS